MTIQIMKGVVTGATLVELEAAAKASAEEFFSTKCVNLKMAGGLCLWNIRQVSPKEYQADYEASIHHLWGVEEALNDKWGYSLCEKCGVAKVLTRVTGVRESVHTKPSRFGNTKYVREKRPYEYYKSVNMIIPADQVRSFLGLEEG